jgi:hypothetical protein
MACRISELVIDCRDPERLAAFWCDVLGYVVLDRVENSVEIGPEDKGFGGLQPTIVFDLTDKPKAGKLPLHIDVNPTDRDQDEELERLLAVGAKPPTWVRRARNPGTSWPIRRATSSACCAGA